MAGAASSRWAEERHKAWGDRWFQLKPGGCSCRLDAAAQVGEEGPQQLSRGARGAYWLEVYLVTALVPSETACLASSPGRMRRMAVWTSRLVSVLLLE
jgi:hypothetical protein